MVNRQKLPMWVWVFAFVVCWPSIVLADPVMRAQADGATVTLYDEPGVVIAYFKDDRTVVAMPVQIFERVQGS